jgi:hypothetical protein
MVKSKTLREQKPFHAPDGLAKLHLKKYPNSICSQYLRMTDKETDLDVLIDIISKFPKELKPKDDDIVIHLRVGDIFDQAEQLKKYCEKTNQSWDRVFRPRVPPISYYKSIINNIKRETVMPDVIIVAGGCLTHSFTESKKYIKKIKNLFKEAGHSVKIRFGHPPDDDFVFMCRSKSFYKSGGGYSILIDKIRKRLS